MEAGLNGALVDLVDTSKGSGNGEAPRLPSRELALSKVPATSSSTHRGSHSVYNS